MSPMLNLQIVYQNLEHLKSFWKPATPCPQDFLFFLRHYYFFMKEHKLMEVWRNFCHYGLKEFGLEFGLSISNQ